MSYIYKKILAGTAFTELIPLNSIKDWETITIANTGADSIINVYLYKVLEAVTAAEIEQGIGETAETIFILHDTSMTADVTLVLDPSDFDFDNSNYSLRFDTTTSADITVNATSQEGYVDTDVETGGGYDGEEGDEGPKNNTQTTINGASGFTQKLVRAADFSWQDAFPNYNAPAS
jgi:hypothetical protein